MFIQNLFNCCLKMKRKGKCTVRNTNKKLLSSTSGKRCLETAGSSGDDAEKTHVYMSLACTSFVLLRKILKREIFLRHLFLKDVFSFLKNTNSSEAFKNATCILMSNMKLFTKRF